MQLTSINGFLHPLHRPIEMRIILVGSKTKEEINPIYGMNVILD